DLLREIVGATVVAQRARRQLIASGRPADAEIDAPGKERLEHAEALGYLERAVVLEHHAAGAHAEPRRARGNLADQHLGARAREAGRGVMLAEPVAVVAEAVAELGELERLVDGVGHDAAASHGGLVEHAEPEHLVDPLLPALPLLLAKHELLHLAGRGL